MNGPLQLKGNDLSRVQRNYWAIRASELLDLSDIPFMELQVPDLVDSWEGVRRNFTNTPICGYPPKSWSPLLDGFKPVSPAQDQLFDPDRLAQSQQ